VQTKPLISLSTAIVCYNSPSHELTKLLISLLDSIEQLRKSFELPEIPVYLIDNSDEDSVEFDMLSVVDKERVGALGVGLRLVHGQGNIGYGSAHNLVISNLNSHFHLLLNPDVVLQKSTLTIGINFLLENPEVIVASPHAVDDKGDKQYLCKRYPSVFTFLIRGVFPNWLKNIFQSCLASYEMHNLSESEPSADISIVSGCFMLLRSTSLKEIEGFDERYFLYFEDFDLSLRLGKKGKLAYLPAMHIQHSGGHAASKGLSHFKMFTRSGIRFFNTHGWHFIR
tara:strand:- start:3866 stop:4714 length:849 start_codon:yes stop_codon:yes gene_type:complete